MPGRTLAEDDTLVDLRKQLERAERSATRCIVGPARREDAEQSQVQLKDARTTTTRRSDMGLDQQPCLSV